MSAKNEQVESDCVTAKTWISSVDPEDCDFGRRESDALDAGVRAYRVIDHFGKSGAKRPDRERALAGAILAFGQQLYAQERESLKREFELVKQVERDRAERTIADMRAAMHAAVDAVRNRP